MMVMIEESWSPSGGEADQAIFGVEAAPKWSHASFVAQSSQFDILINRFGQLHTASVDSWFWTKGKGFDQNHWRISFFASCDRQLVAICIKIACQRAGALQCIGLEWHLNTEDLFGKETKLWIQLFGELIRSLDLKCKVSHNFCFWTEAFQIGGRGGGIRHFGKTPK